MMTSFLRSNVASIVGRAFRRIGVDELSVSAAWRRQRRLHCRALVVELYVWCLTAFGRPVRGG